MMFVHDIFSLIFIVFLREFKRHNQHFKIALVGIGLLATVDE
jgi:hypothetical protein